MGTRTLFWNPEEPRGDFQQPAGLNQTSSSTQEEKMPKRTYRKMIVAMGVLTFILAAFFVSPSVSQTPPIKIGTFTPLSGHAAYYGEHIVIGAKLAIDEINEKGGLLGRKVEFIAEDDKNVPAEAVTAAEKLITKDQVVALSASMGSSPVLAVMPKVNEAKVPGIRLRFFHSWSKRCLPLRSSKPWL